MTDWETALARAAAAWGAAAFGAGLAALLGGRATRRLPLLVGCAAAALLAVTVGDILPDARALVGWPVVLAGAASGAGLLAVVSRVVHPVCPACAGPPSHARNALHRASYLLMAALSLHCILDGVAVSLTGAGDTSLFGAVLLHKVPEGLALCLLLLGAGRSPRAAFGLSLLTESATLLGGVVGAWLPRHASPAGVGFLLAHVGGGFLYLVGATAVAAFSKNNPRNAPIIPSPLDRKAQ